MGFRFQKPYTGHWSSFRALTAASAMLMASAAVQARGTEGHQVIALIAQAQLTPKAKVEKQITYDRSPFKDFDKSGCTGPVNDLMSNSD